MLVSSRWTPWTASMVSVFNLIWSLTSLAVTLQPGNEFMMCLVEDCHWSMDTMIGGGFLGFFGSRADSSVAARQESFWLMSL